MNRLTLIFTFLVGMAGISEANTQFFAVVANHSGVRTLERNLSSQGYYLFSLERARIQPRCLGCMKVELLFRNARLPERSYTAGVFCPREADTCRVTVLEN